MQLILRGNFIRAGEEGYAYSSYVPARLEELGYVPAGDNPSGQRFYELPGQRGVRLVWQPGSRERGLIDYGSMTRQVRIGPKWMDDVTVSLEFFINNEQPFGEMAALEQETGRQVIRLPGSLLTPRP